MINTFPIDSKLKLGWEDISTNKTAYHGPRCGVPDMKRASNLQSRMDDERDKWSKKDLTWL